MAKSTEPSAPLEFTEQPDVVVGQIVGYARVSTKDQNPERQIAQLRKAGVMPIFTDHTSGSTRQRPKLDKALRYLHDGDHLVVASIDRLARSIVDLHTFVNELVAKGVSVRFLKEGQVYSKESSPVATLMLGSLGSVAEFERSIIKERQAEGIAKAKERGVYKGRAKVLTDAQVDQARQWVADGLSSEGRCNTFPF